jgi:hypothetical protein
MSRRVSWPAAKIEDRSLRTDERSKFLEQLTIKRFVVELVEEFPRVPLAGKIISDAQ